MQWAFCPELSPGSTPGHDRLSGAAAVACCTLAPSPSAISGARGTSTVSASFHALLLVMAQPCLSCPCSQSHVSRCCRPVLRPRGLRASRRRGQALSGVGRVGGPGAAEAATVPGAPRRKHGDRSWFKAREKLPAANTGPDRSHRPLAARTASSCCKKAVSVSSGGRPLLAAGHGQMLQNIRDGGKHTTPVDRSFNEDKERKREKERGSM